MFKYFNIIKKALLLISSILYFFFCFSALFFVDLSDQLYFYLPESFSDNFINNFLIKTVFPNTSAATLTYNVVFSILIIMPLSLILLVYLLKPAFLFIPLIGLGGLNIKTLKAFFLNNDCYLNLIWLRVEKKISLEEKINIFNNLKQKLINDYPHIADAKFQSIKDAVNTINSRKEIEDTIFTHLINIPQSIAESSWLSQNSACIFFCVSLIVIGIVFFISSGQSTAIDNNIVAISNASIKHVQSTEALNKNVIKISEIVENQGKNLQQLAQEQTKTISTMQEQIDMLNKNTAIINQNCNNFKDKISEIIETEKVFKESLIRVIHNIQNLNKMLGEPSATVSAVGDTIDTIEKK